MDLNYLFRRQQVEHSLSQRATCQEAREAHARLAELYEESIKRLTQGRVCFDTIGLRGGAPLRRAEAQK